MTQKYKGLYRFERKITLVQKEEIRSKYLIGYELSELGKMYKVTPATIYYYTRDLEKPILKLKEEEKEQWQKDKEKRFKKHINLLLAKKRRSKNKTMSYQDYVDADRRRKEKNHHV